jgi:hypothetical protein
MPLLIVCGTFEVISGPCPIRENLTLPSDSSQASVLSAFLGT